LISIFIPKIFRPSEDQSLDVDTSRHKFEVLAKEINDTQEGTDMEPDEIVYGYVSTPEFVFFIGI
jgi:5-oxoprolinase (ATP-hydrolysing)